MKVGIPREIKTSEYRVGLRPAGVELLRSRGHEVFVERSAGEGAGIIDDAYMAAGATIVEHADVLWDRADLVVKVKEPQPEEYPRMREGQVVFTYFHLAADEGLTRAVVERKIVAAAYETLSAQSHIGRPILPLLVPMSEIAGRLAPQEGARCLERPFGGRGVLLGGVPGVEPGNVLVIGGGVVGQSAATIAYGMGARVIILDIDNERMRHLGENMPRQVITVYSDSESLRRCLSWADMVIGAVLVPGARAPRLIRREHLELMRPGGVIVDVAIDQGGCCETSRVTTHTNPTYEVDGIVHYCVGNMPGAVPHTSTWALTNATTQWVVRLADQGAARLAETEPGFRDAINADRGRLVNREVAEAHGMPWQPY